MSTRNINIREVQRLNRSRVLNTIRTGSHVPRTAISEYTGLSPASVTNIVSYLIGLGLVQETGTNASGRVGRRSVFLDFSTDSYRLISVYCTRERLNLHLVDLSGRVIRSLDQPLDDCSGERLMIMIRDGVQTMLSSPEGDRVIAIGINLSALVLDNGRCVVSSNLRLEGADLRTYLESITALPILIVNVTFTRARWLCRANSGSDIRTVYIDLENGFGASVMYGDDRLPGVIGEIGQFPVGTAPESGNTYGRLESLCSPEYMLELYGRSAEASQISMSDFAELIDIKDPSATAAAKTCATYLGKGIAGLANIFDPEVILINNADFSGCPFVIDHACTVMRANLLHGVERDLEVIVTRFDPAEMDAAVAFELCGTIFSAGFERDIFELLDSLREQ